MQQFIPNNQPTQTVYPNPQSPCGVNINIVNPQSYGTNPIQQQTSMPENQGNFYSLYGQNSNPSMPIYPSNYNNLYQPDLRSTYPQVNSLPQQQEQSGLNAQGQAPLAQKTDVPTEEVKSSEEEKKTDEKKDKEPKKITPLTDEYVKSLENYLNDSDSKVRLIGAKELVERFKESEDRKDNPSLVPLLNKVLKDKSPSVRFLGLVALNLGYSCGNDETVQILKQIQQGQTDKSGQDKLLADEILLKMSAPEQVEVKEGGQ